jgi:hypothetical protein
MFARLTIWILFLAVGFGGLYVFEYQRVPCRQPIAYRIGALDARFGLSEADFRLALMEAEQPWESALGRDLFHFDPQALFPVNLVFDERQERTLAQRELERELEEKEAKQETIEARYDTLFTRYEALRQEYESSLAGFQDRLASYNRAVARWNASDRTDEDEIDELSDEEKSLRRLQREVEARRAALNALVPEVNGLVRAGEKTVNEYNSAVSDFTERYGAGGEFDQGVYQGTDITIYQFDDREHLRMVLVHELGHALGIGHVANPRSIMYSQMGAQQLNPLVLSLEDQEALVAVCSVTATDLLREDFRNILDLLFPIHETTV